MSWIGLNSFLGHGRALETYLVGLKLMFALCIVAPQPNMIVAFYDLVWWVPEPIIAAPFFIIGIIQLVGLILNYHGVEGSWIPRMIGAAAGTTLWAWLLIKTLAVGDLHSSLVPMATMSLLGSSWLWWKAYNRLPVPGAAGML